MSDLYEPEFGPHDDKGVVADGESGTQNRKLCVYGVVPHERPAGIPE
jgi:hypothetical protein